MNVADPVGSSAGFTTGRLRMTPLAVADTDTMVAVLADPGLYRFIGGEPPTVDELADRYRSLVRGSGDPGVTWHNWVVRRGEAGTEGTAIGYVQATVTGRAADVAWLIAPSHQGQGFATEAAGAMVDWLVASGVEQIRAHIHSAHAASQGVAAHLGLLATDEIDDDGEVVWASTA